MKPGSHTYIYIYTHMYATPFHVQPIPCSCKAAKPRLLVLSGIGMGIGHLVVILCLRRARDVKLLPSASLDLEFVSCFVMFFPFRVLQEQQRNSYAGDLQRGFDDLPHSGYDLFQ